MIEDLKEIEKNLISQLKEQSKDVFGLDFDRNRVFTDTLDNLIKVQDIINEFSISHRGKSRTFGSVD